jgi:hypothetical protein
MDLIIFFTPLESPSIYVGIVEIPAKAGASAPY